MPSSLTEQPPASPADVALADELFAAMGQLRRTVARLDGGPFARGSLTGAQVELVRLVRRRPGLSVAEAADLLALAPNTVSTLVSQLVGTQILLREPDERDRRVARLSLAPAARARLERWRDHRASAAATAIAGLEPADRAVLTQAVAVVVQLADAIGANGERTRPGPDDE